MNHRINDGIGRLLPALLTCWALTAGAGAPGYSPHADATAAKRLLWGDTHLHSSYSVDANLFGNQALDPAAAYRFARGETVTSSTGIRARLQRPLDFLVVTDHSEYLGVLPGLLAEDPELLRYETGHKWQQALRAGDVGAMMALWGDIPDEQVDGQPFAGERFKRALWSRYTAIADAFNEPGKFTAFIGYEWTSMRGTRNLHRNVIFADGADRVTRILPLNSRDAPEPEQLWAFLAQYERDTGGRAMAIPHNSNLSGGLMFLPQDEDGNPIDAAYAQQRQRWEPLLEVTQIKGDSETHPLLSPNDEFADFGTWDTTLAMRRNGEWQPDQGQYEYARPALGLGLALEQSLGVNPFRFGMIGSTDSHTALATADDDNYFGKFSNTEPTPGRALDTVIPDDPTLPGAVLENWEQLASGYAAVWATDNTREAIFDALQRREVYATTGPRITLRFFGGWAFEADDRFKPDIAATGYAGGVPMGGILPAQTGMQAPRFLLSAARDPLGANLDRLQVIKGWVGADGKPRERIYDVALAGDRGADGKGRSKAPVGSTVQVSTATYDNSIGAPLLTTVWQDPDFDPAVPAFYYLRVLEIPTPRWTAYDAVRLQEAYPERVPMTVQQRGYSSPIWYRPPN